MFRRQGRPTDPTDVPDEPRVRARTNPIGGNGAQGGPSDLQLSERVACVEQILRSLQLAVTQLDRRVDVFGDSAGDRLDADGVALPEPRPAVLQAYLFGHFHVVVGGSAIETWRSQKAASLLKYLLVHRNKPARREMLMDVFWPSSSAKSARNNLNATVYQLRGILSEHDASHTHVMFRDGAYRIDPALAVWIDAEEYTEQVVAGRAAHDAGDSWAMLPALERARALYRGSLIEGDTSGEWFLGLQERFQMEHCAVLESLASAHLELGSTDIGLERAEDVLRIDPCRESAHQLLMRGHASLEQSHLVVRQYQRCQARLRQDLDVEPSAATTALYRQLVSTRSG